ncbi:MAG: ABC transporter permease [Clostridia bacterium]|nr:ABC transporter permease [Clostridia bacterium]
MNTFFFPRLAWTGIRKNRKLYTPYILSCVGMVMMFYIMHALSYSSLLREMGGGGTMELILSLGKFVIAFFSLLFLFYTNSFLIRRRYKEFGLYNVLGMDKRSIGRIIFWESLIVAAAGLLGGIGLGIAFSKLAELGLLNAIHAEIDYRFTVSPEAIRFTALIYGIIYFLMMLRALRQVRRSKPLELLRTERAGEKPPKANWILAVPGVLILAAAYYMAVTIESPLTALIIFFVAVLMVILATYLLFISGSVTLCRFLQSRPRYYYRKDHFVSVSSMAFRMRRNGAGLASVCILSTMVLVMISSTASLYFGVNDTISARCPQNNSIAVELQDIDRLSADTLSAIRAEYEAVMDEHSFTPRNVTEYPYATITGTLAGTEIDPEAGTESFAVNYDEVRSVYFIDQAVYNRLTGETVSLEPGQALLQPLHCSFRGDRLRIRGSVFSIIGQPGSSVTFAEANQIVMPTFLMVIRSFDELLPLDDLINPSYDIPMLSVKYYYGYDAPEGASDEEILSVFRDQQAALKQLPQIRAENGSYTYNAESSVKLKTSFFSTYGALFFLGIMLSIVFIFAAAMIIYYKQVSEGYEDQARFAIMQKVGMTKEDIKKSINSQVLTVFFAPLLMAGLHLGFAFPLVWKLLQLFSLRNLTLAILVTLAAFLLFAAVYGMIYKITAGAYYSIVSSAKED